MKLVCLDLEGVLLPECWIAVAEAADIPELRRTTREEPDYDVLMRYRLAVLREHGLTLPALTAVIEKLEPLPGAVEFTSWLVSQSRLIILSDTFAQFAAPLMRKLGFPTLFCHELEVGPGGEITNYLLRQADQKRRAVEAFKAMNFEVIASGDSYNDLSMIKAADHGILFRPTPAFAAENPQFPVAHSHDELRRLIEIRL